MREEFPTARHCVVDLSPAEASSQIADSVNLASGPYSIPLKAYLSKIQKEPQDHFHPDHDGEGATSSYRLEEPVGPSSSASLSPILRCPFPSASGLFVGLPRSS